MGAFGGDIHFDEDESWSPNAIQNDGQLDFFTVAVITNVITNDFTNDWQTVNSDTVQDKQKCHEQCQCLFF